MQDVERAAKFLKRLKYGAWMINLGVGAIDTVEAYREGKDWVKEAIKESADLIISWALPVLTDAALAMLALTPIGWVGIITVAAFEADEVMGSNYLINKELG